MACFLEHVTGGSPLTSMCSFDSYAAWVRYLGLSVVVTLSRAEPSRRCSATASPSVSAGYQVHSVGYSLAAVGVVRGRDSFVMYFPPGRMISVVFLRYPDKRQT